MRGHANGLPKPLVEIGGRPILWHVMSVYSQFGVRDFVLCLGYRGEAIRRYFAAEGSEWRVELVDTGSTTMTGGRIKRIEPYIDEDDFFVTYADGLADVDIDELRAFHARSGTIGTVTAVKEPVRFGRLRVEGDRVRDFREKEPQEDPWINGGFFVFDRRVFRFLDGDDCVLEREPLSNLAAAGELSAYRHHGYWQCMDTYDDVEQLNADWNSGDPRWVVSARID